MKVSTLILMMAFASVCTARPSVNYTKQEKVVQKIIDMIFEKNSSALASIFASSDNLDESQLIYCVKEASGKIRSRGSKHLYASRVSTNPENASQTLYEFAFYYHFNGKKVFYYKINIMFDHEQSMYKPSDIEFMRMKELSLLDVDVTSIQAVSPIARN